MDATAKLALQFASYAFAGWAIENAAQLPDDLRYSKVFGGRRIPLLPVYGVGGIVSMKLAQRLVRAKVPMVYRAVVYGLSSAALEYAACRFDRAIGNRSWDYSADPTADPRGCVDLKHAAAWALLSLAVESFV